MAVLQCTCSHRGLHRMSACAEAAVLHVKLLPTPSRATPASSPALHSVAQGIQLRVACYGYILAITTSQTTFLSNRPLQSTSPQAIPSLCSVSLIPFILLSEFRERRRP